MTDQLDFNQDSGRRFLYPTAHDVWIPHHGFIEKLEEIIEENLKAEVEFNAANILTPEIVDYCLQQIESWHASRSKKSIAYLELARLQLLDDRYAADNVFKARDFLLQHADKIGEGIKRLATKEDFYRQTDPSYCLLFAMTCICEQRHAVDSTAVIDELIHAYSSALAEFFHVPPDVNEAEYYDTHHTLSHRFMQILANCRMSVPEFFKNARLQFLKDLAQEAFEYTNQPHDYSHHKALGIRQKFSGIAGAEPNEIGTNLSDPIHLAADRDNNFLIMARNTQGKLTFIFSTRVGKSEPFGVNADSIPKLKSVVGAIRMGNESLQRPVEYLWQRMSGYA